MKLGSLFDGSGGFPLAGSLCGIEPVWASEVEPYPIAVTRSRFPQMKHLGDISKVNGGEIEPVDIITFGSPCQDLSVAGKRAGLKHEANGDEETTRSGLFMEAVRIIKEMRKKTDGRYPAFALWENVPGAFSSNGGEDFRIVCEELIKIVEPTAVMPAVPKNGWAYADVYMGDGWSLAYRVFDAQYWGVPQRRRRIHLVLDLRGERAGEILFEREGVRGYFETGGTPWKGLAGDAQDCAGADDRAGAKWLHDGGLCETGEHRGGATTNAERWGAAESELAVYRGRGLIDVFGFDVYNMAVTGNVAKTLNAIRSDADHAPVVFGAAYAVAYSAPGIVYPIHDKATRYKGGGPTRNGDGSGNGLGIGEVGAPMNTLTSADRHAVAYTMQSFGDYKDAGVASGLKARDYKDATDLVAFAVDCRNLTEKPELYQTLQAKPNGGQSLNFSGAVRVQYIVRRLTPTECARLQGFPDKWGHPDRKDDMTDEEWTFRAGVRNTHAKMNGREEKNYTKEQMISWYNKLHTDSAEYKMWGNGIALPPALYVMQGIKEAGA